MKLEILCLLTVFCRNASQGHCQFFFKENGKFPDTGVFFFLQSLYYCEQKRISELTTHRTLRQTGFNSSGCTLNSVKDSNLNRLVRGRDKGKI